MAALILFLFSRFLQHLVIFLHLDFLRPASNTLFVFIIINHK